jgi:hypothetical protein
MINSIKKSIYLTITFLSIALLFLFSPVISYAQSLTRLNIPFELNKLNEVIPNHNVISDDRINLVFTTVDDDPRYAQFVGDNLIELIGWNGVYLAQESSLSKAKLQYNFFATDPIRDYKNRFNIWFVPNTPEIYPTLQVIQKSKLRNRVDITFDNSCCGGLASKWGRNGQSLESFTPETNNPTFKSVVDIQFPINSIDYISTTGKTLTHELGHALFRFADEYYIPDYYKDREDRYYNKIKLDILTQETNLSANCALNNNEGRAKWAKHIGSTDPMVYEIQQDHINTGIEDKQKIEDYKVDYYPVLFCVNRVQNDEADKIGIIVPTRNSIMANNDNNRYMVWGNVAKEYINNFFETTIKGAGQAMPFVKNVITKADKEQLESTLYSTKYTKIAENYGGKFSAGQSPAENLASFQRFLDRTDPLYVEKVQQTPGTLGYLAIRRSFYKLIRLDRTPLFAGTLPYFNVNYSSVQNEFIYLIFDIPILLLIIFISILIYKKRHKFIR